MSWRDGDDGRRTLILAGLALVLAAGSFLAHYAIAQRFDRLGVFDHLEILFAADAYWFLDGFAEGSGGFDSWGGRGWVHPNVSNLVNPPIRAVAAAVSQLPFVARDAEALRRALAVAVSPAAACLQSALLFALFLRLGLPVAAALLAALFGAVTFSSLIFGSVPESYALSGAGFALLFLLAAHALHGAQPPRPGPWLVAGVLLTSFTSTNLAFFALLFAASCFWTGAGLRATLLRTLGMTSAAAGITALLAVALSALYGDLAAFGSELRQLEAAGPRVGWALRVFPGAVVDTLIAREPGAVTLEPEARTLRYSWDASFAITYWKASLESWQGGLVLALLAGGCAGALRAPAPRRRLHALAALALVGNFAIHAFYGAELFLYSQHWLVPLVILGAGWLEFGRVGLAVVGAASVFALQHNLGVLRMILDTIRALNAAG